MSSLDDIPQTSPFLSFHSYILSTLLLQSSLRVNTKQFLFLSILTRYESLYRLLLIAKGSLSVPRLKIPLMYGSKQKQLEGNFEK